MEKKKVLYVDQNPYDLKSPNSRELHIERQNRIKDNLKEKYSVLTLHNLHSEDLEMNIKYFEPDLLLTHLPYNFLGTYTDSIKILKNLIGKYDKMIPVVYTGASKKSVPDERLKEIGVKAVIRKIDNEQDRENVSECLEKLLIKEEKEFLAFYNEYC
ncbi:hypothetical protein M0R19_01545 [Candidatus Pacearchaeota archaeon]|nr:hypothetical protein [Candidatus Pacearchaeota archaeon]